MVISMKVNKIRCILGSEKLNIPINIIFVCYLLPPGKMQILDSSHTISIASRAYAALYHMVFNQISTMIIFSVIHC